MDVHLENIINTIPENVRLILKTIRDAGYEAYIVGGCVRDILLGRIPGDWDITTSALPEEIKNLFKATVDTGIQHGTVMVIMGGCGYEITTYRIDGEYKDGRHPASVTFTPSLEEDLKRRDFTINAFAIDPDTGIVDLFGGLSDLDAHIIRAVGDPDKRFSEDALRIMRAVRFSAQLSFDIEPKTKAAVSAFANHLSLVSAERIRVEFEKTLYSDNPAHVNIYRDLGLAEYIIPDHYDKCFQESSADHYRRLKEHDTGKTENEEYRQVLLLAAFFKELSSDECRKVMRRMTFDNRRRDLVSGVLKYAPAILDASGENDQRKQIRQDLRLMGLEIFRLCLDHNEAAGKDMSMLREGLEEVLSGGDAYNISMLDITGNDLIAAGVPQGRQIGEMLERLLDEVIEDPSLNRKDILAKRLNNNS